MTNAENPQAVEPIRLSPERYAELHLRAEQCRSLSAAAHGAVEQSVRAVELASRCSDASRRCLGRRPDCERED